MTALSSAASPASGAAPAAPPSPPPPAAAHPPLQGSALLFGTVALSLATFMNVLDSSIANVSIPAIAGDLGVSPGQGTWVITSFGVANAISVPLTGWLTHALWRSAPVHHERAAVRAGFLAVRLCLVAGDAGVLPRAAGPGGRAHDSAVANPAAVNATRVPWRAPRWPCGA